MEVMDRVIEIFAKQRYEVPDGLCIVDGNCKGDDEIGLFRIMTLKDGDRRVVWNRMNLDEISAAKKMFNELISSGMVAYHVDSRGNKTNRLMKVFDPSVEEIIFIPMQAVSGG